MSTNNGDEIDSENKDKEVRILERPKYFCMLWFSLVCIKS